MLSKDNIRKFEFWLILPAVVGYVVRRLFTMAYEFDADFWLAKNTPRLMNTGLDLTGLEQYNHEINTILPTILGAALFLLAWYLFHYQVFPRWKSKENEQKLFYLYALFTVICVFASVFVYHYFKLYWRFRFDSQQHIIGFKVFSNFRKLYLISHTFAGIVVLFFYEAIAQMYYYTSDLYEKEKQLKHQMLQNLILLIAIISILFVVFFGTVANLVLGDNGITGVLVFVFLCGIFHLFIFEIVIPYLSKLNFQENSTFTKISIGFGSYILAGGVVMIYWMNAHFGDLYDYFNYYILPNLVGIGSAIGRWYFFAEKSKLQTQVFQKTAELSTLRSQINPHFLFNSLNTLYSVSLKENAEKTSDGIQKLGDMMRFMLNENNQDRIPISKEIEYLENYLSIQQMRLDENQEIELKVNIQQPEREIFIAPMLLNPFVENAFKHGISFRNPSWIFITLTFDEQKLYFKVHNSLHQKNENDTENENHGIGLENVRKRLELIYPNRHQLDIQESKQDFFVSLTLNFW